MIDISTQTDDDPRAILPLVESAPNITAPALQKEETKSLLTSKPLTKAR